jgi:hypothetical protein
MIFKKMKKTTIHLKNNKSGSSFCGLDGHKIYMRKDRELVGMKRLSEVNCKKCLVEADQYYYDYYIAIEDKKADIIYVLENLGVKDEK